MGSCSTDSNLVLLNIRDRVIGIYFGISLAIYRRVVIIVFQKDRCSCKFGSFLFTGVLLTWWALGGAVRWGDIRLLISTLPSHVFELLAVCDR